MREIENRSPLHYFATSYLNPDRPEEDSSSAMDMGRAVHTLLLSEDGFRDDYVTRPDTYPDAKTGEFKPWNGNATVCREWLAEQKKAGKTVLLKQQVADIQGMAERLSTNQVAMDLLRGRIERSIVVKDKLTGAWIKSRPDSIPADTIIADLKTCADASQVAVTRSIVNFGYLQQMALAITCLEEVGQKQVNEAVLLYIETTYPYAFNIKPLDNGDLYTAMRQNRRALNTFAECLKSGVWPSYADSMLTWSAPKWWSPARDREGSGVIIDPDFREVDEPIVTLRMGKRAAEWVSHGLSDQLCWCNGFNAALSPSEDHDRRPMGTSQMRELNIALKRAIEKAEEPTK